MNENEVRNFFATEWNSLSSLIRELEQEAWNAEPDATSSGGERQVKPQNSPNDKTRNQTTDDTKNCSSNDRLSSLMQQIENRLNSNGCEEG